MYYSPPNIIKSLCFNYCLLFKTPSLLNQQWYQSTTHITHPIQFQQYSSCALSFFRDLLLLFNNAVVFFPKSSLESLSAHQLRRLVLNEMKKNNLITRPPPNPSPSSEPSDSLVAAAVHSPPPTTTPAFPPPKQPPKRLDQLERSDSLLAKHKSTAPIIVCRKRSSISSKPFCCFCL